MHAGADLALAEHFQRDLGQFAGKHVDEHDSAGAYTCMISMNSLSETDSPGYFMADIGVAIGVCRNSAVLEHVD